MSCSTWNPGAHNDHVWTPEGWNDNVVRPLLDGESLETTWSVGQHVNNIEPGDAAFMYRQGERGRGIVARGIINSYPEVGPHFDGTKGKTCNYVQVIWQEAVPTEMAVDVSDLAALAPEFPWHQVYGSGRQIPSTIGERVTRSWKSYVSSDCVIAGTQLYSSDLWRNYLAAPDAAFV